MPITDVCTNAGRVVGAVVTGGVNLWKKMGVHRTIVIRNIEAPMKEGGNFLGSVETSSLTTRTLVTLIRHTNVSPRVVSSIVLKYISRVNRRAKSVTEITTLVTKFPVRIPNAAVSHRYNSDRRTIRFTTRTVLTKSVRVIVTNNIRDVSHIPVNSDCRNMKFDRGLASGRRVVRRNLSTRHVTRGCNFAERRLSHCSLRDRRGTLGTRSRKHFRERVTPLGIGLPSKRLVAISRSSNPEGRASLRTLKDLETIFGRGKIVRTKGSDRVDSKTTTLLVVSHSGTRRLKVGPEFEVLSHATINSSPALVLAKPVPTARGILGGTKLTVRSVSIFRIGRTFTPIPLT